MLVNSSVNISGQGPWSLGSHAASVDSGYMYLLPLVFHVPEPAFGR